MNILSKVTIVIPCGKEFTHLPLPATMESTSDFDTYLGCARGSQLTEYQQILLEDKIPVDTTRPVLALLTFTEKE